MQILLVFHGITLPLTQTKPKRYSCNTQGKLLSLQRNFEMYHYEQ